MLGTLSSVHAQELSFKGKTITVVIPFSAGGSTDLFARSIANKLNTVLPGNPTVKPVNMTGGGGVLGSNYVYNSAVTDGTMILINAVMPWYQIMGDATVRYDVRKSPILATFGEPEAIYVSKESGIGSAEQLIDRKEVVRAAALSPNNTKSVFFNLMARLMNYETKVINGYPGGPEMRLAVQRGEAQIGMETLSGFFGGILQNKAFLPIMQSGIATSDGKYISDPRLKEYNLPTMFEVVEKKFGAKIWETTAGKALGTVVDVYDVLRTVSAPPNTDPRAVAALRNAMNSILNDPNFQAEASKINGYQVTFKLGEESQVFIDKMMLRLEKDQEVIKLLQEITKK